MLSKEQGYDEYLAQKEQKGLQDSAAGRVCSLAEANAQWQAELDAIAVELKAFEQEVVNG